MAQPPRYQRVKDFGADYPDQTDNQAINSELDAVSRTTDGLRTNLAKIQRDDGGLKDGIVTKEALAQPLKQELYDEFSGNVSAAVQAAQQAAGDANTAAIAASSSATAAAGSATEAENSATAAATSEGNASTSAIAALNSANASAASASAALVSENHAALSESAAAGSATAAAASASTAGAKAAAAANSATASSTSATAAAASATAASDSAAAALASEGAAATSETNAAASASAAAVSEGKTADYLAAVMEPFTLVKTYDGPCIAKTSATTVSIRAGTYVSVAGAYKQFTADTAITMPALTAGEDYSVWVKPDGTAVAVADPYSSPAVAPAAGAVKIGGFHNGLVAPGTTVASGGFSTGSITGSGGSMAWAQADVDRLAGINEFSIWDLAFRCAGEQRGMFFEPLYREWWGIYFMSTDADQYGPSRYNTDVASGTVLPLVPRKWGGDGVVRYDALNGWTAHEMVSRFNLHLPLYDRFMAAAFGVTEGQSLGGSSVTIPATGRTAGYTSRCGMEQATGHVWIIGASVNAVGGSAYAGNGRGSWYGSYGLPLFGGSRDVAAYSGSRCAAFNTSLGASNWNYSVRAAGDHLNLGRTAR